MAWQIWLVSGGVAIWLVTVAMLMTGTGSLRFVDDQGFVFRNRALSLKHVYWRDLAGPALRMTVIKPRVMLRRSHKHFFQVHSGYTIILSGGPEDDVFLNEVHKRFTLKDVTKLTDFRG